MGEVGFVERNSRRDGTYLSIIARERLGKLLEFIQRRGVAIAAVIVVVEHRVAVLLVIDVAEEEAGAEDVIVDEELATVIADPPDFLSVKESLEAAGLALVSGETGYLPQNTIQLQTDEEARKVLKLLDALEENDDVQAVYANHEFPDGFQP